MAASVPAARAALPHPDHVVIVVEENHAATQVIGTAPYLTSLARAGANFTQSFAVAHPSQPNYLALFSGSTQGLTSDSCPHTFIGGNLGAQLRTAKDSFAGYSESLPSDGFTGCTSGRYARKHSPWVNFANLPPSTNLRFTRFPTDFATLPTVSFVIPNLNDDAHDGSLTAADNWLKAHLSGYVQWAKTL
jgi:phosphatidylinositol-3-phosphatase